MLPSNDKILTNTAKILQNLMFWDIPDLPDLPDGDQKSCTPFQSTHNFPRIPKRYHMWGYNAKIPIKTAKILQNPMFWTFLTFLIFLMVTKNLGKSSKVIPRSQGFQKGIICESTMTKSPSKHREFSQNIFDFLDPSDHFDVDQTT